MYDAILVPTDGSPGAEAAIDDAVHIAAQNDATVHVVYVVDQIDAGRLGEEPDDIRDDANEVIGPVTEIVRDAGLEVTEEVLEGTPDERIVEYARSNDIDMIVIGTHGKNGLSRVLLGSTAEKIVRESPVPVLSVRREE